MSLIFCPECIHLFEIGAAPGARCPICDGRDQIRELAQPAVDAGHAPWFALSMAFLAGVILGACLIGAFRL